MSVQSIMLLSSYTCSPHWGPHESYVVVTVCIEQPLHRDSTTQRQYRTWKWKKRNCGVTSFEHNFLARRKAQMVEESTHKAIRI